MNRKSLLTLTLLLALLAGALPAGAQDDDVLYVSIIWHQHQPVYFKDPETGIYERPWVRVHASKDYLDMAAILEDYPDVHATFNITPSLIRQLDDIAAGAKDLYWVMTEIPADALTDEDKAFLLAHFFDTNSNIIARFPRYGELAQMRSTPDAWETQDFRDLQVLFNLAWTDPDWLAEEPLASLVAKGENFDEADKAIVLDEHLRIVQEVIPYHAALQEAGQIEVTMTPFAHPILPLLVDSNVASVGLPEADLPPRFVYGQDAVAHLELGVQFYQDHFGTPPRGMWPAEGSVSQGIVQMVSNAGIQWIASDEEVLALSLPDVEAFTRDSQDTVQQADALYRPYTVTGGRGGEVAIIFRDKTISDLVGFQYSGTDGQEAADDFIARLDAIQAQLKAEGTEGPHLVTVLLDGENAWEHYPNDGKEFLHAMYQGLSEAENLVTVTPSEFLEMTGPPRAIENLWPGSWVTPDYATWIGEDEENLAWTYLLETRDALRDATSSLDEAQLEEALTTMYIAEGSDWFWWYGADQDSGADEDFDAQFRSYLKQVYEQIGQPAPSFVYVPIISQPAQQPDQPSGGVITPVIDGAVEPGEWDNAAAYTPADAVPVTGMAYGFDDENFYLRIDTDGAPGNARFGLYLRTPDPGSANAYSRNGELGTTPLIGFGARRLLDVLFVGPTVTGAFYEADGAENWTRLADVEAVARGEDDTIELAIPIEVLSPIAGAGDRIDMRLIVSEAENNIAVVPAAGPAFAVLPDQDVPNIVLEVADPTTDDHGPGGYTYPTDTVFPSGVFDFTGLVVGQDDEATIFRVLFRGPVDNSWNSPNGLSIQTIDIYIDVDGPENGARLLLPGRNAALPADHAWDYVVWVEGWTPGVYTPGAEGPVEVQGVELDVLTNPGQRRVTIRVPHSAVPGDPATWSLAAVVSSQEGYPSSGVWRIRDVLPAAEQWRIGGAPADATNHTRIMDVIYPEAGVQEQMLSDFAPSQANVDELGPDDFGKVPMLTP